MAPDNVDKSLCFFPVSSNTHLDLADTEFIIQISRVFARRYLWIVSLFEFWRLVTLVTQVKNIGE